MVDINENRAKFLINAIEKNKDLDLNARANQIRDEILDGPRDRVLGWFGILIDLEHAKHYGLGETVHLDRPGGWGYLSSDDKFLSSLRAQHLGHCYGVTIGTGNLRINALTGNQVDAIRRTISGKFYTMQMALISPGDLRLKPVPQLVNADPVPF